MSTLFSRSILFPDVDAASMGKANSIIPLITKTRRYNMGGVPLTQDEQEQIDNWLAESDDNILLYTHLTDHEYLKILGSMDLKEEKKEVLKLSRSQNRTRLKSMWRLIKARAKKLIFCFSHRK